ncbi:hypothetical protein BC828DRAFT_373976 [Blastocladiella britannica]|nr:hypothetical protein BC828DRAFT_373976 [Blastocladiella britannica]
MSTGETAFLSHFLAQLAQLPVEYPDHYLPTKQATAPANLAKPLVFIPPPPPSALEGADAPAHEEAEEEDDQQLPAISVTFKQLKPAKSAKSATPVPPTTTRVRDLKLAALAALGYENVTTVNAKLLVKGKALADDAKTLAEYGVVAEGAVVHVMVTAKTPEEIAAAASAPSAPASSLPGARSTASTAAPASPAISTATDDSPIESVQGIGKLAKDAAFWADVRAVVDRYTVEVHGLAGGDAVAVLAAMRRAVEKEADSRSSK